MRCHLRAPHDEHRVEVVGRQGERVAYICDGIPHPPIRSGWHDLGFVLGCLLVLLPAALVTWGLWDMVRWLLQ